MQLKKKLKNGQVAMFFKTEDTCILYPGKILHYIDFVVGNTEAYCMNWYKDLNEAPLQDIDTSVTGKGDVEALLFALHTIEELMQHLGEGEVLIIQPTDAKRERAYRRLLKYGFKKQRNHYIFNR